MGATTYLAQPDCRRPTPGRSTRVSVEFESLVPLHRRAFYRAVCLRNNLLVVGINGIVGQRSLGDRMNSIEASALRPMSDLSTARVDFLTMRLKVRNLVFATNNAEITKTEAEIASVAADSTGWFDASPPAT